MSFNDFVHKHKLKIKATSNIETKQILSSLSLNDVRICFRDVIFSSDIRIVNLHPSKGPHWLLCIHDFFFDSYGCSPPQKLSQFIIQRNGHFLYSEYKLQSLASKKDSYCASYSSYKN